MPVIIIESPNKREKIAKYSGMKVLATVGHFKDLPVKEMGIDLDNNYRPSFVIAEGKAEIISRIKAAAKGETVYIASDPDREGYAIGRHVYDEIKGIASKILRAEIHEITNSGIKKALDTAIPWDQTNAGLYDAFLGRRVGDRLVGYTLSPAAGKAITHEKGNSLSVGRVQSPAVRLIVDREREIRAFVSAPFWQITATLQADDKTFITRHTVGKFTSQAEASAILKKVKTATNALTGLVERKEARQSAKPPFTTVDMQAAASSQLQISPETSMQLAQDLFSAGLITYHRTDSVRLAPEAIDEIRNLVLKDYGRQYLPEKPVEHKSKNSQAEAHEGIRPTHFHALSEVQSVIEVEKLSGDHAKLYAMIWRRAVASQMSSALFNTISASFDIAGEPFVAKGRVLQFEGWRILWVESDEEKSTSKDGEDEESGELPPINQGDQLALIGSELVQGKTKAPGRFSEATLVKELEKLGIGRPSTYASIVSVIKKRSYVAIKKSRLESTDRGEHLVDWLAGNHAWVIDYNTTRDMEEFLDQVEHNGSSWETFCGEIDERMGWIRPKLQESRLPSELQIKFADGLAKKTGLIIPEGAKTNAKVLSEYIEKAKKAADKAAKQDSPSKSVTPLSEKQISIINKSAPQDIKDKVSGGNHGVGRKWLNDYFRDKK